MYELIYWLSWISLILLINVCPFLRLYHAALMIIALYNIISRSTIPLALLLFSQKWFSNSESFVVHKRYRIICSHSMKNAMDILTGIVLNLWIALDNIDILTTFSQSKYMWYLLISLHHFQIPSSMGWSIQSKDLSPTWLSSFLAILFFPRLL